MSGTRHALPDDLLHTDAFLSDPFPAWQLLRQEAPVWHDPIDDRWVVTRHEDVLAVFRDDATFAVARPYRRFSDQIGPTLVNLDGPAHAARRAIVAPELVGQRLERSLARIEARTLELFRDWPEHGPPDAQGMIADRLPLLVIADLLGLDDADHPMFAACSAAILDGLGGDAGAAALGRAAHARLAARFEPSITSRARDPEADLISAIVSTEVDGVRLTADEVRSTISLILVAGGETTGLAIAGLWADIVAEPGLAAALRADPDRIDDVITESLRRNGPVIAEDRETTHDAAIAGVWIPAGALVRAVIGSANNDERVFAEPRMLRPGRQDLRTGKGSRAGGSDTLGRHAQLGFGAGSHFCPGYQLAQAEMRIATRVLLDRSPALGFAGAPPAWRVSMGLMRPVARYQLDVVA